MKKIKLQLFGRFTLESDKGILEEDMISSNQLIKILVYMLIHRDKAQSHQSLIDIFWDNDSKNPKGSLKNLVYRLRNTLKVLGDDEYICTSAEAYQWNPEIEVETDFEQWEKKVAELRKVTDASSREKICEEIISEYNGNVTKRLVDEPWILSRVMGYESQYLDTVKTLCEILESQERWAAIEEHCRQAMKVDSLDEDIQSTYLRCLYGQKKYDLALLHYEKVNKMFYESMGNYYPEKIRAEFQKLLSENSGDVSNAEELHDELEASEETKGAFYCDYQVFRQIYQMESRRLKRFGMAEYVMFLTLKRDVKGMEEMAVDPVLEKGMSVLEQLLRTSLRIGDVITRYSRTQFIVLLPACSYESGIKVGERIEKQFQKAANKMRLTLDVELKELTAYECE